MRRKLLRKQTKAGRVRKKQPKKIHWFGLAAILLGLLAFFTALYFYAIPQQSEYILGQAIMLHDTTSEFGARQWIIVKLDNGRTAQVRLPNEFAFEKGATVRIRKVTTELFGSERFSFAGYQKTTL